MKKLLVLMMFLTGLSPVVQADPAADYELGRKAFDLGDVSGAMKPLRQAADAGNAKAQALYGYVLDISEFDVEALGYYQKAADQGDPDGQYGLAQMYISGEAGKKDPKLARQWLEKAAHQNMPQAVQLLGEAYVKQNFGIEATELESPEAAKWINAAAELKSTIALNALLDAYTNGKYGIAANAAKAAEIDAKIRAAKPEEKGKKRRRQG